MKVFRVILRQSFGSMTTFDFVSSEAAGEFAMTAILNHSYSEKDGICAEIRIVDDGEKVQSYTEYLIEKSKKERGEK